MKTKDHKDGKIIIFSDPLASRAKILYAFYCLSFMAAGIICTYLVISVGDLGAIALIVVIILIAALFIAAFRFMNKAFLREEIFINKTELKLISQSILYEDVQSYDITKVSNFRYLNKPELTKHPLAGQTFDYLGFQTEQQVINEMHGDKRLAFDYEGKIIVFGENIYSWEFEELKTLIFDNGQ